MTNRRVVVTGLGVISALGPDVDAFWQALSRGRSGIGPIERVDCAQLRFKNGAELHNYRPEDHFEKKRIRYLDRYAQLGLIAAREAIADAGVAWTPALQTRTGVITGSSAGGLDTHDDLFVDLYDQKLTRVSPLCIPRIMANAGTSQISMAYGLTGPAFTVSSACSSSNHAIGQAGWMVRAGLMDAAVTGGTEAPFSYGNLKAWEAMRVVAQDTCRPFSKDRSGMVLGEGGAMMVIESLEGAQARGARIYGEIAGFGMSADAHHLTQPSPQGAAQAVRAALEDAGITPEQVGYVNAHGTATRVNDAMEARVIHEVFATHAGRLAVSSTKSMHGHTLGAAGALEGVATLLALRHGFLPPTANFTEPDPECDLDVLPNEGRVAEVDYAVSNSFAFGGLNAVLVFRRWDA